MLDCLDEHIKEKNKIRPENVYSCIKKIKRKDVIRHIMIKSKYLCMDLINDILEYL